MATASGVPQFGSLYVGDLHPDVTEAMLFDIFVAVGPVASVRVCRRSDDGNSLGYGYVNYHSVWDAEQALSRLNYTTIHGRPCRIMWCQPDSTRRKNVVGNVFVKNLDRTIDNRQLFDTFSTFGNIVTCKVLQDAEGRSKGCGFVHYESEESALRAIEHLNGVQIGQRIVQVCIAEDRNERDKANEQNTNLYVKNFPITWDEAKLKEVFIAYGSIMSARIQEDQRGRKFAFVNYYSASSAQKAIEELHQRDMRTDEQRARDRAEGWEEHTDPERCSYILYVGLAQTREERRTELAEKFGGATSSTAIPERQGSNLFVKNLDETTTDETLRDMFAPHGTVTSAKATLDDNGLCKGYGFVAFSTPEEATIAVTEMHLKIVNNKSLYVSLAESKDARQERLRSRYSIGWSSSSRAGPSAAGGKAGKDSIGGKPSASEKGSPPAAGPPTKGKGYKGKTGSPSATMGQGGAMRTSAPPPSMGKGMQGMMSGQPMPMAGNGMPPMQGMMGMKGKGPMLDMPDMCGKGMMCRGMPGMMPMGPPGAVMGCMPCSMGKGMAMPHQAAPSMMQMPQSTARFTAATLAAATPPEQKRMLGEMLFPRVAQYQPELAGRITGLLLDMDNSELLMLMDNENELKAKVDEAMCVLEELRNRS